LSVREAELISKQMVNDILDSLPDSIKVSNREVVSLHNAFVNHPTAKVFKDTFNREMCIKDDEGNTRFITDNSKGYHEGEYIDPNHAVSDSVKREHYEADLIFNEHYEPSVVKLKVDDNENKLNSVMNILDKLNNSIQWLDTNIQSHSRVLDKMESVQEATLDHFKREERRDRIKSFIDKYR